MGGDSGEVLRSESEPCPMPGQNVPDFCPLFRPSNLASPIRLNDSPHRLTDPPRRATDLTGRPHLLTNPLTHRLTSPTSPTRLTEPTTSHHHTTGFLSSHDHIFFLDTTQSPLYGFICTHYQHDTLDKTDNKGVRSTVPPWWKAQSAPAKIASGKSIIEGWEEK
jgi:hypothetical protein